jgi:hypothetical protein
LYYIIASPFPLQLCKRGKHFEEHKKDLPKNLETRFTKIGKRIGSSKHRTEETMMREFKNHKNK